MSTLKQNLAIAVAVGALSAALVGFYARAGITRLEHTVAEQADVIRKFEASVAQANSVFAAQAEAQRALAAVQAEVNAASLSLTQEVAKIEKFRQEMQAAAVTQQEALAKIEKFRQEVQAAVVAQREALAKVEVAEGKFQRHIQNFVVDRKNLIEGVQGLSGEVVTEMNRVRGRVEALEEANRATGSSGAKPSK